MAFNERNRRSWRSCVAASVLPGERRSTSCPQGLRYHRFELGKNSDPSKEQSDQLTSALTVHPVSDPEQMYRLHRFFTEIELQKTYSEIVRLQVS